MVAVSVVVIVVVRLRLAPARVYVAAAPMSRLTIKAAATARREYPFLGWLSDLVPAPPGVDNSCRFWGGSLLPIVVLRLALHQANPEGALVPRRAGVLCSVFL